MQKYSFSLKYQAGTQYKWIGHTDGNTKIYCQDFILALSQSTTAIKLILNNTRYYKTLFPVCEVAILQVTVNKIEV